MTPESFIQQHIETTDLHRLLLSARQFPGLDVPALVRQIEALRKIRHKAPDWYRPDLNMPPSLSVEQASSADTASFKTTLVSGMRLADLTGGMGIDSQHFAKVFEQVDYVEQQPALASAAEYNFRLLGATNIRCFNEPAADFLQHTAQFYDVIYLDPARRGDRQQKVFQLTDCTPDVLNLLPALFEKTNKVLLKTSPMLDLTLALRQLGKCSAVWVVALQNEVRECLFMLEKSVATPPDLVDIHAVNLLSGQQPFRYLPGDEKVASPPFSMPLQYLYEPNAAIMKSGGFGCFAQQYGLSKLHEHSHLYTSEQSIDAPGRRFRILEVSKYDKKTVQAIVGSKASITARNFPDSVEQIRKKLGIAEGGQYYLFATRLADQQLVIVVCEKG